MYYTSLTILFYDVSEYLNHTAIGNFVYNINVNLEKFLIFLSVDWMLRLIILAFFLIAAFKWKPKDPKRNLGFWILLISLVSTLVIIVVHIISDDNDK